MQWKNRTRGYQKKGIKDRLEGNDVASTLDLVSDLNTSDHASGDEEVDKSCLDNDCVQSTAVEEANFEVVVESCCLGIGDGDSVLTSQTTDSQDNHDSNEWKVYWDSFYGRSYFYNIKTQESKWEPPLGMEHLAYSDESHSLNELSIEVIEMDVCLSIFLVKFEEILFIYV